MMPARDKNFLLSSTSPFCFPTMCRSDVKCFDRALKSSLRVGEKTSKTCYSEWNFFPDVVAPLVGLKGGKC
jgi:hypothetical protein